MSIVWQKRDPWHCESECGRYSISRSEVDGASSFLAFRRGEPATLLGDAVAQFRDAAALCEADAIVTRGDGQ